MKIYAKGELGIERREEENKKDRGRRRKKIKRTEREEEEEENKKDREGGGGRKGKQREFVFQDLNHSSSDCFTSNKTKKNPTKVL